MRFGVMCGGSALRAWQADVIRKLCEVDDVEPVVLVVDARPAPSRAVRARIDRLVRSPNALWNVYNNGWVAHRSRALQSVPLESVLPDLPRIDVVVERKGYSEYFPEDAIDRVRSFDLDFMVRFSFGIIRGAILESARYGVWSFHHDDEDLYRGSPPAFWEIVDDQPVSGAMLQRLTDRLDGGIVLDKGWFRTTPSSYVKNTDAVHEGCTDWPARAARRLLADGDLTFARPSRSTAPIYRAPDNRKTAAFLLRQGRRSIAAQLRGLAVADHWELGIVRAPIAKFLDPGFEPEVEWQQLSEPGVAYAADPFPVDGSDGSWILYERFDARRRIGEIWRFRPGEPSTAEPATLPIREHVSYPYCFEADGRTYCVPQIKADGVRVFELAAERWVEVGDVLPGVRLLDPTIVEHDGRWWMFGTVPGPWSLTKLYAFWADDVLGPWRPHLANPVKTDVRSARPAGTPFRHEGGLFRPAQDCSEGYGAAVAITEVMVLDPVHFEERVVRTVRPGPDWPFARGIHTLSGRGPVTVLDARSQVFDRRETAAEFRARVRRLKG